MSVCLISFLILFFSSYPVFSCNRRETDALSAIALNLVLSYLLYYALFLLILDFKILALVLGVISLFGLIRFLIDLRYRKFFKLSRPPEAYLILIYLGSIFASSILQLPINKWDTSAIWFFASKIIYTSQGRGLGEAFTHPSLAVYFHLDYPKLFPTLAAALMSPHALWDEYTPKIAVCFLAMPAFLWLVSFYQRNWSFLFLLAFILFNSEDYLWNGYMDGYVSVYFVMFFLLIRRFFEEHKQSDLFSALACLGLISNLKNEGLVLSLCVAVSASIFYFRKFKSRTAILSTSVLIPSVLWWLRKQQWGLHNYLNLSGSSHFRDRFFDLSSWKMIGNSMFFLNHPVRDSVVIFSVLLIALLITTQAWKSEKKLILWLVMTTSSYFCGLFLVYLATPFELGWHLATSNSRTTLPLSMAFNLASYFLINILVKSASNKQKLSL